MRVLIVDDNEMAITLLRATLVEAGYEAECARDGREAIQVLRDHDCRLFDGSLDRVSIGNAIWILSQFRGLDSAKLAETDPSNRT